MFKINDHTYDRAIIGETLDGRAVYDIVKMVHCLKKRDGMTQEEAVDFIKHNTMRIVSQMEKRAPVIMFVQKGSGQHANYK